MIPARDGDDDRALYPRDGARFLFVREDERADGTAAYRASVYTPTTRYDFRAVLPAEA
jgi:hypothetical protein